ncbi:hypothetical protein PhaeoP54_00168 [Phaeobacter inhibens]|nr:hypothetical protein PhaeoP54_00168 [Phaeobacter inhibens]
MAGLGQHFDLKAHHSAKIGQSSMSKNGARQAAHWNQIFEQKGVLIYRNNSALLEALLVVYPPNAVIRQS